MTSRHSEISQKAKIEGWNFCYGIAKFSQGLQKFRNGSENFAMTQFLL